MSKLSLSYRLLSSKEEPASRETPNDVSVLPKTDSPPSEFPAAQQEGSPLSGWSDGSGAGPSAQPEYLGKNIEETAVELLLHIYTEFLTFEFPKLNILFSILQQKKRVFLPRGAVVMTSTRLLTIMRKTP